MIAEAPACIHHLLEGKINEFILTETSRRAMDELFAIVENIQIEAAANNPADHYNPSLVDSRTGLQPLNYAFKRMQPITTQYPTMRRASGDSCASHAFAQHGFNGDAPDAYPLL
jgi:hypothetical protein